MIPRTTGKPDVSLAEAGRTMTAGCSIDHEIDVVDESESK